METVASENYWIIIAILLLILEVFTPGFVLASFGIACFCSAIAQYIGFGISVQLSVFAIFAILSFVTIRPLAKKYLYENSSDVAIGVKALIGKRARVTEKIQNDQNQGRVQVIGSDDWRAFSDNNEVLEVGEMVEVKRIEGITLIVSKASN